MSRLDIVTVVIVAICLAALGYLLFKTFNMIGGGTDDQPVRTEMADEGATATDGLGAEDEYDPFATDNREDDGTEAGRPTVEGQEGYAGTESAEDDFSSDYDESPASTAPAATQPATTTETAPATTAYAEGQYMVIAGTFRQRANAERMVSRLKGMGYAQTRVELFNRGRFAVALVNRFSSLTSARQLERELEAKGIEAEVITD
jgi:cell division protein FtsN